MADQKLTALTQLLTAVSGDYLYIVDDPSGSPVSKYITVEDLLGSNLIPQFSTIELGHASDTTLSRSAAGQLAVEGTDVQYQPTEGAFEDGDKTKLDGVASGAEVNPDVVSQAEAEAGTATTERVWTAERVKQAIAALESGGLEPESYWGGDLIRNFPSLELADDAQPEWWEVTNDPTLHEVDLSGESVAEKHARGLKLTISADGGDADYAYQDFDEADEPTLDDGVTKVSAGVWVYQKSADTAGTITLELYDVDGTTSLGTDTTAAQDAWTWLEIEDIAYQDSMRFRITHSANSAVIYFTMPMLNIGSSVRTWAERLTRYVEAKNADFFTSNPSDTNWADVDFSTAVTPLTIQLQLLGAIKDTGGGNVGGYVRRNGSAVDDVSCMVVATGGLSSYNYSPAFLLCDDQQIIEQKVNSTIADNWNLTLQGYWEWR